jgi:hypothetical protein
VGAVGICELTTVGNCVTRTALGNCDAVKVITGPAVGLCDSVTVTGDAVGLCVTIKDTTLGPCVTGSPVGPAVSLTAEVGLLGLCDAVKVTGTAVGLCDSVTVIGDAVGLCVTDNDATLGPCVTRSPVGPAVSLTAKIGLLDGTLTFVNLVGLEVGVMDGEVAWVTEGRPATSGEGAGVNRERKPSSEGALVGAANANSGGSARVGACEKMGNGFDGVGAEGVGP